MTTRTIAIKLKIPDNEAYTALSALRRLGIELARLERAEIWTIDDGGDAGDFVQRVERNETIFNPNKHELHVIDDGQPGAGEVWIEAIGASERAVRVEGARGGRRYTGWRLFAAAQQPADAQTVCAAVERLLCNSAIERAIT